jgi:hypothetical protein
LYLADGAEPSVSEPEAAVRVPPHTPGGGIAGAGVAGGDGGGAGGGGLGGWQYRSGFAKDTYSFAAFASPPAVAAQVEIESKIEAKLKAFHHVLVSSA